MKKWDTSNKIFNHFNYIATAEGPFLVMESLGLNYKLRMAADILPRIDRLAAQADFKVQVRAG